MTFQHKFLLLSLLLCYVDGEVKLKTSLDRDELHFGDTLTIKLGIFPGEYMEKIAFDVRFPEGLEYFAVVNSEFCDGARICESSNRSISSREASLVPKWSFDNELFVNCTKLIIVERETAPWLRGYRHETTVLLQRIASTKVHSEEFVIAFLRYWNKTTTSSQKIDEIATQKYRRRGFRLIPVRMWMLVNDQLVVASNSSEEATQKVFLDSVIKLQTQIIVDLRGLPVKIVIKLPEIQGSELSPVHLKSSGVSMSDTTADLDTSIDYTLVSPVHIPSNPLISSRQSFPLLIDSTETEISLLITKERMKRADCYPTCNFSISLSINLLPELAHVGDILPVSATAFYGRDFSLTYSAEPTNLEIIGPDLSLLMQPLFNDRLEAGSVARYNVFINHSIYSTESLNLEKIQVNVYLQGSRNQITEIYCKIAFNNKSLSPCKNDVIQGLNLHRELHKNDSLRIEFALKLNSVSVGSRIPLTLDAQFGPALPHTVRCLPEPCLHGGVCVSGNPNSCSCSSDFTGKFCSKRVCPENWINPPSSDLCFFFPEKTMTFLDAETFCSKLDANLPVISSKSDQIAFNVAFNNLMSKSTLQSWIGFKRDSVSQKWQWRDDKFVTGFRDWAEEPTGNESCAVSSALPGDFYKWRSRECADKLFFLCESRGKSGPGSQFNKHQVHFIDIKDVTIVGSHIGLGDLLRAKEIVNIEVELEVPLGELSDVSLDAIFQSSDIDPIPMELFWSEISGPEFLNFTRPDLMLVHDAENVSRNDSTRRKRSILLSTLTISRYVGDVVNSANAGKSGAPLKILASYFSRGVSDNSVFSGSKVSMEALLLHGGKKITLGKRSTMFADAFLKLEKQVHLDSTTPRGAKVVAVVSHFPNSTSSAYDLEYCDDISCISLVIDPPGDQTKDGKLRVRRSALQLGERMEFEYSVESAGDRMKRDVPTENNATLVYKSYSPEPGSKLLGTTKSTKVSTCFFKGPDVEVAAFYHLHGFSVLGFLLTILVTFILCLLAMIYWYKRKRERAQHSAGEANQEQIEDMLAMPPSDLRVEIGTMTSDQDQSLVPALTQDGKQNIIRTLDRQAVMGTIQTEKQLRDEKLRDMVDAAVLVVEETIDRHHSDKFGQKMKNRAGSTFKKVDREYEEAAERLKEELGAKNQDEVNQVREKQRAEHEAASTAAGLESERAELNDALNSQQAAEMGNLFHRLQLEQELELQKLKAEFAAKKESALLALQSHLTDELANEGSIDPEKAESIGAELSAVGSEVTLWYDRERAKQRALLEHKYNLRKTLALQKDLSDRQRNDLLNTILEQQVEALEFMKKRGLISEETAESMKKQLNSQADQLKLWFDSERRSREKKLQKTVATENKQKVSQLKKKHEKEIADLTATHDTRSQSALQNLCDKQQLLSEQKQEFLRFQENLDQEAAAKLDQLHQELVDEARSRLHIHKSHMFQEKGIAAGTAAELLREQEEELQSILAHQKRVKEKQDDQMEEDLRQKQSELKKQMDQEVKEQTALREHEHNMLKNLLEQQASLSEEERKQLLRYKEEHLAQMENSLSVGKLAQLGMLETKLELRRASAVEKLEQQALQQKTRKNSENNSEFNLPSDVDASVTDDVTLIREVAREKLDILKETSVSNIKEIRQVQSDLMEERARELRDQENKLGAMVGQLQMNKAKQMAKLEEQEEALQGITSCMVEDLTERGILSNPDCHKIIERHELEQKKLSESLSAQKLKQEFQLMQQLEERALRKSSRMSADHKFQMRNLQRRPYSSEVSRKIANANLLNDQAKEKADLPAKSAMEMEQCLAEEKRKFEMRKKEALQEQEMRFIGNLIEMGEFVDEEISHVLKLVFPQKSKAEIKDSIKTLFKNVPQHKRITRKKSREDTKRLAKKVEETKNEALEIESRHLVPGRKKKSRRRTSLRSDTVSFSSNSVSSRPRTTLPPISKRPEPLGASVDEITEYLPPKRLAKLSEVNSTFHY